MPRVRESGAPDRQAYLTAVRPVRFAGSSPLGLGSGRDGSSTPGRHDASEKVPLALTLQGAGGSARSGISHFSTSRRSALSCSPRGAWEDGTARGRLRHGVDSSPGDG